MRALLATSFVIFCGVGFSEAQPVKAGVSKIAPKIVGLFEVEDSTSTTTYQLISSEESKSQDQVIRKEGAFAIKTISISKGLSSQIKSDFLNLIWESNYKEKSITSGVCGARIRIQVQPEEKAEVCDSQQLKYAKAQQIEKKLRGLFRSQAP